MTVSERPESWALLLLDFQHDFLDPMGRMPVAGHHVAPMLAATTAAVGQARGEDAVIVKIGNAFAARSRIRNVLRRHAAIAGSHGAQWDSRIDPQGAVSIAKWKPSAFCNPALGELLTEAATRHVVIAGLYARACVAATARQALHRGLEVTVLTDAVACRSDASRAGALTRMSRAGVSLATTDEWIRASIRPSGK